MEWQSRVRSAFVASAHLPENASLPAHSLTIEFTESLTGKFWAKVKVESEGSPTWKGEVIGAETQVEALELAIDKLRREGSRHKRGPKPNGLLSVASFLERRVKLYEPSQR